MLQNSIFLITGISTETVRTSEGVSGAGTVRVELMHSSREGHTPARTHLKDTALSRTSALDIRIQS